MEAIMAAMLGIVAVIVFMVSAIVVGFLREIRLSQAEGVMSSQYTSRATRPTYTGRMEAVGYSRQGVVAGKQNGINEAASSASQKPERDTLARCPACAAAVEFKAERCMKCGATLLPH